MSLWNQDLHAGTYQLFTSPPEERQQLWISLSDGAVGVHDSETVGRSFV
jgi:hypothetical protein